MCCGIALLGILGPRALIVFWYIVDPARWSLIFNHQIFLPALGFILLPWTTIMYVLFWTAGGIEPIGWLFIVLAVLADLATYGGGGFGNRDRMRGYYNR
jgi:hypothetical protein